MAVDQTISADGKIMMLQDFLEVHRVKRPIDAVEETMSILTQRETQFGGAPVLEPRMREILDQAEKEGLCLYKLANMGVEGATEHFDPSTDRHGSFRFAVRKLVGSIQVLTPKGYGG